MDGSLMVTKVNGNSTSTFGGDVDVTGNVITDAPTFHAYNNANQSVSSATWTKVQLNTKEWDTSNDFDTSNYRYTPTVAGYYQVNMNLRFSNSGSFSQVLIATYKNGSQYRVTTNLRDIVSVSPMHVVGSLLVYLNGATDYIEFYANIAATSPIFAYATTENSCWMEATLARAV